MELTEAQRIDLTEAKAKLPEGFTIVESAQLQTLVDQKNQLQNVFRKMKPVFEMFGGGGDLMSQLPKVMPTIMQLQKDQNLGNDLQAIIEGL